MGRKILNHNGRFVYENEKGFMWTIWAEHIAIGLRALEAKKNHTPQLKSIWKNANTYSAVPPVSTQVLFPLSKHFKRNSLEFPPLLILWFIGFIT